jgi:cation diffusion facilitator family transporter
MHDRHEHDHGAAHGGPAAEHGHVFLGPDHARNERRTLMVIALTTAMMAAEIAAGIAFGSMALLADGFHMATHAGALAIAALAYRYARRHAEDPRFSFGTGKLGELAGFASAVILSVVALMIGVESALRLGDPQPIRFDEAILVAVLGLAVNLASAWLLHDHGHSHHHGHAHDHRHEHSHTHGHVHVHVHRDEDEHELGHAHPGDAPADHNLRSAYFHVLADALTSVLAIVALIAGRAYGWVWMDPAMGIVGAVVIARWSWGLLRGAGAVLLDMTPDGHTADAIRARLERDGDVVADLHLWRVGPGHMAGIVAIVADRPQPPAAYKARVAQVAGLSHLTVEVHPRAV